MRRKSLKTAATALLVTALFVAIFAIPVGAQDEGQNSSSGASAELTAAKQLLDLQKAAVDAQKAKIQAQQELFRLFVPGGQSQAPSGQRTVSGAGLIGSELALYETLDKFASDLLAQLMRQDGEAREFVVSTPDLVDSVNQYKAVSGELTRMLAALRSHTSEREAAAFLSLLPELVKGVFQSIGDIRAFFSKDVTISTTDLTIDNDLVIAAIHQAVQALGASERQLSIYNPAQQKFLSSGSSLLQQLAQVSAEVRRIEGLVDGAGGAAANPRAQILITSANQLVSSISGEQGSLLQLLQAEQLAELVSRDTARILHLMVRRAAVQDRTVKSFFKGTRIDTMSAIFGSFAAYDNQGRMQAGGAIVASTQSAPETPDGRKKKRRKG